MSIFEEMEAALPGMSDEEVLETFHRIWFKSGYWQRMKYDYRSALRATIRRLVTLDLSEVDLFFEFARSAIVKDFSKSLKGEELKKKNPAFAKLLAKLFRYKLGDDIGYKPVRKIDCCFTQLEFLASGGFITSRHLPALCELLEIDHSTSGSSRRWQILSLCADNSVIAFVRKMWDGREELGHSDHSILGLLSCLETKKSYQTLVKCFLGTKENQPWRGFVGSGAAPSAYFLQAAERGLFLEIFFPALNPLVNVELNDSGLLEVALKCREAGHLPDSSEELIVSHLDLECARLVGAAEELDSGDPDIHELRYPLGHTLRRACRLKHHPKMKRWYRWAMAHPMPEVRINVLPGMIEAGTRIPAKLLDYLGQSPICRPKVFSILETAGKLRSVPSSFFSDESIAQSAVAVAVEGENDNCFYPPNRLRMLGVVDLPAGRYVVMGRTAIEHWEPVTSESAESVAIVGPMNDRPSLAENSLPAVRLEFSKADESDLSSWVQEILDPKDEEEEPSEKFDPAKADPDGKLHVFMPKAGKSRWTTISLVGEFDGKDGVVDFALGAQGKKGKARTMIEVEIEAQEPEIQSEKSLTFAAKAILNSGMEHNSNWACVEAPWKAKHLRYRYNVSYSGSKNDSVYFCAKIWKD